MANEHERVKQTEVLRDLTVSELLEATKSSEPNPGGGGIACMTAAFAMQLSRMAAEITGESALEACHEIFEGMETRADRLSELLTEDGSSFQGVLDALRMPKSTEEEKSARKQKMQEGYIEAIEVPFEAAELMLWALERQEEVAKAASKISICDVATATLLLEASLHAVLYNVVTNAKGIKDEEKQSGYLEKRKELDQRAAAAKERALLCVQEKLNAKKEKSGKAKSEKSQSEKVQSEKSQPEKVQSEKVQSEKERA